MCCPVLSALSCFNQSNCGVSSEQRFGWEQRPEGTAVTYSHLTGKALMHVAGYGHSAFWICYAGAKPVRVLFICTVVKIIMY